MVKTLTSSEMEKLPFCRNDWMKHKCDYRVVWNKEPTDNDCIGCFLTGIVQTLTSQHDVDVGMCVHMIEEFKKLLDKAVICFPPIEKSSSQA